MPVITLAQNQERRSDLYNQIKSHHDKKPVGDWTADELDTWNSLNREYDKVHDWIEEHKPINPLGIGLEDAGGGMMGKRRLPGSSYQPPTCIERGFVDDGRGNRFPVLGPKDSFAEAVASGSAKYPDSIHDYDGPQIDANDFLRAFAAGPRTSSERAALQIGIDPDGGVTVPRFLSAQMIDLMRSKSRVIQAGASTIQLDTEKTDYSRVASDPIPAWRVELEAVNESQPSFDKITFQARSLAVLVKASEEVLQDSVNIGAMLPDLITTALAQEVDRVALAGSGVAPEPLGVFNFAGINVVDPATDGFYLTDAGTGFTPLLDAELALLNKNLDADTERPVITSPMVVRERNLMTDSTGQPLRAPAAIENWRYLSTTKVPEGVTQGANSDTSWLVTGKWDDLIIATRSELRLRRLNERFSDTLEVGFLATLRMDVGAWRDDSFVKVVGIRKTP